MLRHTLLTIERKAEVLSRIGLSRSTLHNKIVTELWCPPISLGGRAVGFLKHETDELIAAYANNYTPDQIRELVLTLVKERKGLVGVSNG